MIDPQNIRQPYEYLVEPQKVIKIDELPDYDLQDWDLNDPKEYIKFIRAIEKTVRGSFEYRAMVSYLKQTQQECRDCRWHGEIAEQPRQSPPKGAEFKPQNRQK